MKICHIITKPELGGAQLTTLNILLNLPKNQYDVSVITSPKGILKSDFANLENVNSYFCPFLIRSLNPIVDILALIYMYFIYKSRNITLVHTHSSKAGILGRWAARFAKVPKIIHTVHGWPFNDYQPLFLKKVFIFLERLTAQFTTKIICVSKRDLELGLKYKIAPKEKFVFINYGIDLLKFRKSSLDTLQKRKELGIFNDDPIVGMISCLKPQKSPLDYIKACIKIYESQKKVNFLLIGDGILRAKCKRGLADSPLNGRFIFAGWRRDVSEILDIMDIAVLTSKWEGMPISIIEALSKGCPVVITDVGGARELVRDGVTGYITQPGAYEETADKVLQMLKDQRSFMNMRKTASLSIDEKYDLKIMMQKLDELYRSLV